MKNVGGMEQFLADVSKQFKSQDNMIHYFPPEIPAINELMFGLTPSIVSV